MSDEDQHYQDIEIDNILERFGYDDIRKCVREVESYYEDTPSRIFELDVLRDFYNDIRKILGYNVQSLESTMRNEE